MKRVMVDQGSGAKIMYPDLFKGLNLKPEDLKTYDSHFVSFDGKVVIPKGQIRLPMQAGLVYYVRKSLHEAEVRYLPLEKAVLVVVHGICKLPHYFQSHTVTKLSLRSLLRSANYTERIAKWGTILGLLILNT